MIDSDPSLSKQQRAIEAGGRIFLRFGFARATMGDIAEAAGMSRPALYLLYRNKEAVFEAVIADWTEDSLARISAGIVLRSTLGEKLQFACETWSLELLERSLANPDVRHMSALPAVRRSYQRFEAYLTDILRPGAEGSDLGATAPDLARVIVSAMLGFKQAAQSADDMRHLISVQILAIERALTNVP